MKPLLISRQEADSCRKLIFQMTRSTKTSSGKTNKPSSLVKLEQSQLRLENISSDSESDFVLEPSEDEDPKDPIPQPSTSSTKPWEPPAVLPNNEFEWTPTTKQLDHLIPAAKPQKAAQGTECQQLGDITFNQIRYA
ncbi:unnamed protein product [Pieris brassicae]|uniref:Uncharacterized protein n=1 Tax=Pieris brassicae TaxID=7116 RepID=A0A9P0TF34_PIEBR|nr:unnamed protein product [Pieris brassicae]